MSLPKLFDMNLENIPSIKKYFKCDDKKILFLERYIAFIQI